MLSSVLYYRVRPPHHPSTILDWKMAERNSYVQTSVWINNVYLSSWHTFFLFLISASFAPQPFTLFFFPHHHTAPFLFLFSPTLFFSFGTITSSLSLKGDCIPAEMKSFLEFPRLTMVEVGAICRLVVWRCFKVISWIFLQRQRQCSGHGLIKAGADLERPHTACLAAAPSLTSNWMCCEEMATSTWPGARQSTSLPHAGLCGLLANVSASVCIWEWECILDYAFFFLPQHTLHNASVLRLLQ